MTSMTDTQSLLPLLTNRWSLVATIELGLAPPTAGTSSSLSPTNIPVLILAVTVGLVVVDKSTIQTENDSGALGSPRPGTRSESVCMPSMDSLVLNPDAGKAMAVSASLAGSRLSRVLYSYIPTLAT